MKYISLLHVATAVRWIANHEKLPHLCLTPSVCDILKPSVDVSTVSPCPWKRTLSPALQELGRTKFFWVLFLAQGAAQKNATTSALLNPKIAFFLKCKTIYHNYNESERYATSSLSAS